MRPWPARDSTRRAWSLSTQTTAAGGGIGGGWRCGLAGAGGSLADREDRRQRRGQGRRIGCVGSSSGKPAVVGPFDRVSVQLELADRDGGKGDPAGAQVAERQRLRVRAPQPLE